MQPCLSQVALCLCWKLGEEKDTYQLPHFQWSLPTCSNISVNRSVSCLSLALCKLPFLCCLSVQAAVSLRAASKLSLTLPTPQVLMQQPFKSSRLQVPPLVFKATCYGYLSSPCELHGPRAHFSALSMHTAPTLLHAASLCLSDLPNHSAAASSLY